MENLFITQLIASIIVGGVFVAFQTLLAERAPQKIAGILLSIPSTLAIALFFMGLTHSPIAVANVIPVIPVSFGISLIFCTTYVYLANGLPLKKTITILLSTMGSMLIWSILAIPIAYWKINSLIFSLSAYTVLLLISHYLLAIRSKRITNPVLIRYTPSQKITRSIIGGLIIGLVIIIAKLLGPFWGAIFSAFPAVYLSTLLIIHSEHNNRFLFHVVKALPISSPIFIIYAFVVQYTYPRVGIVFGTLIAFTVCSLYPITVTYFLGKKSIEQ